MRTRWSVFARTKESDQMGTCIATNCYLGVVVQEISRFERERPGYDVVEYRVVKQPKRGDK
jgi:hypothetical protein